MPASTITVPSALKTMPGTRAQEAAVSLLAERQDHGIGRQGLELPGRLRQALFVQPHHLDREFTLADVLDRAEPLDLDALGQRLVGLELLRGHVRTVPAVDDQRLFGAEPARGSRSVHRRIAAAVDDDAAAKTRRIAGPDVVQQRDGVDDAPGIARRNVDPLADLRADRDEDGIEMALGLLGEDVFDLVVEGDLDPHGFDAAHFLHEIGARQAIGGNAEMQHAAGQRTRVADFDGVAKAGEMIGRRQPARAAADHQDALAARRGRHGWRPALLGRKIAEKPFHGMDADRAVELAPIAVRLARMIADAPVHGRKGVVAQDRLPRLAVFAGLRQIEPCLHVLACRTGVVARRQEVDIDRPLRADGTRALFAQHVDDRREIRLSGCHVRSRSPAMTN